MPPVKIDLLKLFLVVSMTVGGIKLTSLLPQGYYFSFASAFSEDLGAFIIPRPLLAAKQQCELEIAKGVSFRNCAAITTDNVSEDNEKKRQAVIQAAMETQAKIGRDGKLEVNIEATEDGRTPEETIVQIEQTLSQPGGFLMALDNYVLNGITSPFWNLETQVRSRFDQLYQEPSAAEPDMDPEVAKSRRALAERIYAARERFLAAVRAKQPILVSGITLEQAEKAARDNLNEYRVFSKMFSESDAQFRDLINPIYMSTLRDAGLDPGSKSREVDLAAAQQSGQYITALLIRLFVPLVVVFVWVLLTGDRDRTSMCFGTAFAAFILAWPVAVLWSSIVSESYHELRPMFLGFYCAYVASYLTAGFLGASLALRLRGVSPVELGGDDEGGVQAGGWLVASLGSLPSQIFANLTSNAAAVAISYAYFGQDVIR